MFIQSSENQNLFKDIKRFMSGTGYPISSIFRKLGVEYKSDKDYFSTAVGSATALAGGIKLINSLKKIHKKENLLIREQLAQDVKIEILSTNISNYNKTINKLENSILELKRLDSEYSRLLTN